MSHDFKTLYLLNGASYKNFHEHIVSHIQYNYGLSVYIMTFELGWHWKVKSRSFGVHWAEYHTQCIIRQRSCRAERPLVCNVFEDIDTLFQLIVYAWKMYGMQTLHTGVYVSPVVCTLVYSQCMYAQLCAPWFTVSVMLSCVHPVYSQCMYAQLCAPWFTVSVCMLSCVHPGLQSVCVCSVVCTLVYSQCMYAQLCAPWFTVSVCMLSCVHPGLQSVYVCSVVCTLVYSQCMYAQLCAPWFTVSVCMLSCVHPGLQSVYVCSVVCTLVYSQCVFAQLCAPWFTVSVCLLSCLHPGLQSVYVCSVVCTLVYSQCVFAQLFAPWFTVWSDLFDPKQFLLCLLTVLL